MYTYFYVAAVVSLNQLTYSVNEDNTLLQPTLILTNPSSTDITIEVLSANGSAFGKYIASTLRTL